MRDVKPDNKVNLRVVRDGKPQDIVVIARPAIGLFDMTVPPPPGYPGGPGPMAGFNACEHFVRRVGNDFGDMELAMLTPELGRYFGASEGVLVVRKPDNDAYKLEDGDVILSIDDRKPTSGSHATRIIRSYQPGDKVAVKVMRAKETR